MVERPPDLEVHVISVRNGGVPAGRVVPLRAFHGSADGRTAGREVEPVLVDVLRVRRVQVSVVEKVLVVAVADGAMAAARAVPVLVRPVSAAAGIAHLAPMLSPSGARVNRRPCGIIARCNGVA